MERELRGGIRIEGERIASVDFGSMFLRLAYVRAGIEPPPGDLYGGIIPDDTEDRWREGLKVVVNALLFRSAELKRLPKASAGLLPEGWKASSMRTTIFERHAPIRSQFEAGAGPILTKIESDILVAILLQLIDEGVTALPLYDAVLVRHDEAEGVADLMRKVAAAETGFELPVKVTPL